MSQSQAGGDGSGKGKGGRRRNKLVPIAGSMGGSGEWSGGFKTLTFEEAVAQYDEPPLIKVRKGAALLKEALVEGAKAAEEEKEGPGAAVAKGLELVKLGAAGVEQQLDAMVR